MKVSKKKANNPDRKKYITPYYLKLKVLNYDIRDFHHFAKGKSS